MSTHRILETDNTYTHELDERVVDSGAVGEEEATTWAEVVEEEQYLLL